MAWLERLIMPSPQCLAWLGGIDGQAKDNITAGIDGSMGCVNGAECFEMTSMNDDGITLPQEATQNEHNRR